MELLRFFTAGNVDDGKSTLIGRLLYDSGSISTDIIQTLSRQSKTKAADTEIDLALLTDGLRAEREQGITIDVAHKFFSTKKRKFIIADTPGHVQYTRNMVTGASNAHLAIILVDARNGVTEQTKRHTVISSLLRIPNILVCVNKMDLVNYSEQRFNEIMQDFLQFCDSLQISGLSFIPVSAVSGDNVVKKSPWLGWFKGRSLLEFLETVDTGVSTGSDTRFQVQFVIRPQTEHLHDYRGYAGRVSGKGFRKGDRILVLPGNVETEIVGIEKNNTEVDEAVNGESVVLHLKDDADISRGTTLVPLDQQPNVSREISASLFWMETKPLKSGDRLLLRQGSFLTRAVAQDIEEKLDFQTLGTQLQPSELKVNEIGRVRLKTADELVFDDYQRNRSTGAFILVNEHTNATVAAGMISAFSL